MIDGLTPGSAEIVIFPPIRPNVQNTKRLPQRKDIPICWFDLPQINQKSMGAQKLELFDVFCLPKDIDKGKQLF